MDVSKLYFCCGVGEIGNLPYNTANVTWPDYVKRNAESDLREHLDNMNYASRGCVLATTLATSQREAGELLAKYGFKEIARFKGREVEGEKEIILWLKILKPVEKRNVNA